MVDSDAFIRYYDLPGHAPSTVYLHGVGYAAGPSFAHIATRPPLRGRRAVLIDLLGFGFSDRPVDFSYTVNDHAASVVAVLEDLDVMDCDLVGHSMGGSIAILIAASRPDLVSRLVVIEANLDSGPGPVTGSIVGQSEQRYVEAGHRDLVAELRRQATLPGGATYAELVGMYEMAAPWAVYRSSRSLIAERAPSFREILTELSMPRTFVVGSATCAVFPPPATGEDGAGLRESGIDRIVVPDAGHPMMFQNPDGLARSLAIALPLSEAKPPT